MNTILVWLLISMPSVSYQGGQTPAQVVERFATREECERVAVYVTQNTVDSSNRSYARPTKVGCIQATIIK